MSRLGTPATHGNVYDNCRNEREKSILQRFLHWMHVIEDRDGSLNGHRISVGFHGKSIDVRDEKHLESTTFED